MAGAKREGGWGREKSAKVGKRKGSAVSYPLSPIALPFPLPSYPLPLSTPATQATVSSFVTYKYSRFFSVVAARDGSQVFLAGRGREKGRLDTVVTRLVLSNTGSPFR